MLLRLLHVSFWLLNDHWMKISSPYLEDMCALFFIHNSCTLFISTNVVLFELFSEWEAPKTDLFRKTTSRSSHTEGSFAPVWWWQYKAYSSPCVFILTTVWGKNSSKQEGTKLFWVMLEFISREVLATEARQTYACTGGQVHTLNEQMHI